MTRSRNDLRQSQVALIEEMKEWREGIAVLGMGGGKTCAALTVVQDLIEAGKIDRAIVVAPPNVAAVTWPAEPAKWSYLNLEVEAIAGTPARRLKRMRESTADVLTISIDSTAWLVETLKELGWDLSRTQLFIDEISKYKSPTSKRGRKLRSIADRFAGVWGLTGTPRPGKIEELFSPIKIVGGNDVWGFEDFYEWRREYFKPLDFQGIRWAVHDVFLPDLERIAMEYLVYAPTDIVGLPDLHAGEEFVKPAYLSPTQQELYDEMFEHMIVEFEKHWQPASDADRDKAIVEAMSRGAASMKMTQIMQGFMYSEKGEAYPLKENPKLDVLADMDDNLGGDRALVVYGFTEELSQLRKLFKGRRLATLGDSATAAQAMKAMKAWNAGEIDRLLLHPASAAHGIELQYGGHHIIHYHPTWSPELYAQVVKRLHRPGQEHDVFSWWIGAKGATETIDDMKWARVHHAMAEEETFKQRLRKV